MPDNTSQKIQTPFQIDFLIKFQINHQNPLKKNEKLDKRKNYKLVTQKENLNIIIKKN